jgi:hypothetical protein
VGGCYRQGLRDDNAQRQVEDQQAIDARVADEQKAITDAKATEDAANAHRQVEDQQAIDARVADEQKAITDAKATEDAANAQRQVEDQQAIDARVADEQKAITDAKATEDAANAQRQVEGEEIADEVGDSQRRDGSGGGHGGSGSSHTDRLPPTPFDAAAAETGKTWLRAQADHAWAQRKEEFDARGIGKDGVQNYIQSLREQADQEVPLRDHRIAYGKAESGKSGWILVDNPLADNGGTVMNNNDIYKGLRRMKKN